MNLLDFKSKLDIRKGKYVFDPIRKKEIVITPEELVRQLLLVYLMEVKGYPKNRLSVEKQILVNGLPKRFDVLVYGDDMQPLVLIECKAPAIKISEAVLYQVASYNRVLQVKYCIMTNGIETVPFMVNYDNEGLERVDEIWNFEVLNTNI